MIIRFTKGNSKPDTMTCIRDNGSVTFAPSTVGTRHDIIHYAVETTLGYDDAFYGLIAKGRDIDSFGTCNGRKDIFPVQALQTEIIVSLLQFPAIHGPALTDSYFFEQLAAAVSVQGVSVHAVPAITVKDLTTIRENVHGLFVRWNETALGDSLELIFPKA